MKRIKKHIEILSRNKKAALFTEVFMMDETGLIERIKKTRNHWERN
ncbi:MAG: hypothetical protein AB1410_00180 [Acidobacteriota bacterium]